MIEGIQAFVELCKEVGKKIAETVAKVAEKFSLSQEAADEAVKKYW